MVNIEDFIKRLEKILDYYGINASTFADKIGVQRSSLSHLLSGRNKPSLDFILKILEAYPDVDLYWILNGKGSFPKISPVFQESDTMEHAKLEPRNPTPTVADSITEKLFLKTKNEEESDPKLVRDSNLAEVEKIVFFYKDGTFKIFNP